MRSHDAAFQKRPERFNRLCVDFAAYKLIGLMRDEIVLETESVQIAIPERFISRDQIDSARNRLSDEIVIRG
jgi:hypothetical protein